MVDRPRIDIGELRGLEESDRADWSAEHVYEGERYEGATLTGALEHIGFEECEFDGVEVVEATLRRGRFRDVVLRRLAATELMAPYSTWRDVRIAESRLGAAELYDSEWDGAVIERSKLDFVNLRGSRVRDVVIDGCQIGELDLGGVEAERVAIRGCRIGTLDVTGARLGNVDLRTSEFSALAGVAGLAGTTIDTVQLAELAPLLAAAVGIDVEDS